MVGFYNGLFQRAVVVFDLFGQFAKACDRTFILHIGYVAAVDNFVFDIIVAVPIVCIGSSIAFLMQIIVQGEVFSGDRSIFRVGLQNRVVGDGFQRSEFVATFIE